MMTIFFEVCFLGMGKILFDERLCFIVNRKKFWEVDLKGIAPI